MQKAVQILNLLDKYGVDTSEHSIFSPSSSKMWIGCPGSLVPNLIEPNEDNPASAEGTVAHDVAEKWLISGIKPVERVGEIVSIGDFDIEITNDMLDYLDEYVSTCSNLPGYHFIERRVDFSHLMPIENQTGTADHISVADGVLRITDLKFGKGVFVEIDNNPQLIIYAIGAFEAFDDIYSFKRIIMTIVQPRMNNTQSWEISREELLDWAGRIKRYANDAWCTDAERRPGDAQCLWCKVKTDCKVYESYLVNISEGAFDDLTEIVTGDQMAIAEAKVDDEDFEYTVPDIKGMNFDHKVKVYAVIPMMRKFFDKVQEVVEKAAIDGVEIEGFKLIKGRQFRKYLDEKEVVGYLSDYGVSEDDVVNRKLASMTDVTKILRGLGFRAKDVSVIMNEVTIAPNRDEAPLKLVKRDSKGEEVVVDSPFDDIS